MKIIDVAEFYTDSGGGVKTYINQKLKFGAESGHEVVVIAPGNKSKQEERYGGRVIWVKSPRLIFDKKYHFFTDKKAVHDILDKENPDIVEGSSPWSGGWFAGTWEGDAPKSFIFHQDPVAVYPHTFLDRFIDYKNIDKIFGPYWRYLQKLSGHYDSTIVSGEWLAKRIGEYGVNNPEPIPFGIDKSLFSPARRDPELRAGLLREMGLPEEANLLISVSRLHPEKRLGTVIEGVKRASKKKPMGLLIFGRGPFGGLYKMKAAGAGNIRFMGLSKNREELANILASADYFVHGSSAETYGIVIAEAICSGLPLVVPDRGGAADLTREKFSEVYEPGRVRQFENALLKIMSRNREEMAGACSRFSESEICTMNDHFKHLFSFYEKLAQQNK